MLNKVVIKYLENVAAHFVQSNEDFFFLSKNEIEKIEKNYHMYNHCVFNSKLE